MVRIPFTRHSIPQKAHWKRDPSFDASARRIFPQPLAAQALELPAQVVRLADFDDDAGGTPRQLGEARLPLVVLGVKAQRAGRRKIVFRTAEPDQWPDRFVQLRRPILLDCKSDLLIVARDRGVKALGPAWVLILRAPIMKNCDSWLKARRYRTGGRASAGKTSSNDETCCALA